MASSIFNVLIFLTRLNEKKKHFHSLLPLLLDCHLHSLLFSRLLSSSCHASPSLSEVSRNRRPTVVDTFNSVVIVNNDDSRNGNRNDDDLDATFSEIETVGPRV